MKMHELQSMLISRGELSADAAPPPEAGLARPWYLSFGLGLSGWLAGLFALLFIAILFKPDSSAAFALIGAVMLGAAFGLYYADRESAFFDQLGLAFSMAGQLAVAWAVIDGVESESAAAALIGLMQIAVLIVMPNRLAKTIAAFFAALAWALALRFVWWGDESWRREHALSLLPSIASWTCIWLPLLLAVHFLIEREAQWMASRLRQWLRPALSGWIAALVLGTWASEPFAAFPALNSGPATLDWIVIWPLMAAVLSLFAMTCAFRLRSRALIGLGIFGALLHLGQFYFLLGTTLIIKSIIMIAVGAAALFIATRLHTNESTAGEAP